MQRKHVRSWFLPILLSVALIIPPVGMAGAAPAPGAPDSAESPESMSFGADAIRAQGLNRLGTSVVISQQGWQSSEWVVIATSQNFPDALVAGPLASALGAPVLLTPTAGLADEVAAEIVRLGARNAVLIGGEAALSAQVELDLLDAGIAPEGVERIAGSDRYETARLVAMRLNAIVGETQTVVLATGEDYPDALSVSGLAGANGVPILLTRSQQMSTQAARAVDDLGALSTLIVGGEGAVSAEVATLTPHPTRIGGANRYDTARLIAEYAFACGFTYDTIIVAKGSDYPDALCAGPYAARLGAPVVLTGSAQLSPATDEFFNAHCTSIQDIIIIGGESAISLEVEVAIEAAARTEIAAEAVIMDAATASEIESIAPDGSSVVFAAGSPEVASIETSQILVSAPTAAAPAGMLLRVLSVTDNGATISVETTQATLDEVVKKGSLDVTGTVDPNRDVAVSKDVVVSGARAVDDTHVDLEFETIERSNGSSTEFGDLVPDGPAPDDEGISPLASMGGTTMSFAAELGPAGEDKAVDAGVSKALSIDGAITFNGGFTLNASWGHLYWAKRWWGWESIQGLKNITLTTYISEYLTCDVSYVQSAGFDVDIIKLLEERLNRDFKWQIGAVTAWVGWVPVYMTFNVEPVFTVGGSVSGSVGAKFTQYSSVTLGIRYDYGVGWRPIRGSSNSFSIAPSVGAGAEIGVDIGAKVNALFYGIAGPYFGVTGGLGLEADVLENPWWTATASVDGIYGAQFSLFGKSASLDGSVNLWSHDIASATGPFPSTGVILLAESTAIPVSPLEAMSAEVNVPPVESTPIEPLAALTDGIDATTLDVDDFTISGLDVLDAQLQPDGVTVRLTTSAQERGSGYVVSQAFEGFRTEDDAWAANSSRPFVGYAPPVVEYAAANVNDQVDITFDSYAPLDPSTLGPEDFTIPGLTVDSASLNADGQTVTLGTSAQAPGQRYTVSVIEGGVGDGEFVNEVESVGFSGFADYTVSNTSLNHSTSSITEIGSPDGVTAYAVGMSGVVSKTTNGGATWTRTANIAPSAAMNTGVGNSYEVRFPGGDPNRPVASVYLGVIARSTNGGTSWLYWDNDAVSTRHGLALDFASATRGVATVGGQLLISDNAGATWARHSQDGAVSGTSVRFAPSDSTRGYICSSAGTVYRSVDSGTTWNATPDTGTTANLMKIVASPSDEDIVLAVGAGGVIIRTEDGGDTWSVLASGQNRDLHEISWADDSIVFASGAEGAIVVSRDGGRTWSVVRAPSVGVSAVSGLWAPNGALAWSGGVSGQAWKITGN